MNVTYARPRGGWVNRCRHGKLQFGHAVLLAAEYGWHGAKRRPPTGTGTSCRGKDRHAPLCRCARFSRAGEGGFAAPLPNVGNGHSFYARYDWGNRPVEELSPDTSQHTIVCRLDISASPNPNSYAATVPRKRGQRTTSTTSSRGDVIPILRHVASLAISETCGFDALGCDGSRCLRIGLTLRVNASDRNPPIATRHRDRDQGAEPWQHADDKRLRQRPGLAGCRAEVRIRKAIKSKRAVRRWEAGLASALCAPSPI